MFAALIAAAIAADTVVYAGGDAALVVARVAALSGTSPSALRAVTVTDLVKGRPPALLGGGKLQSCGGGPSATGLHQSMHGQPSHKAGLSRWRLG